jgi:hypothetical protein
VNRPIAEARYQHGTPQYTNGWNFVPKHDLTRFVEAENLEAVDAFLFPGFKRCTSKITPVSQEPIVK